jgi:hypothetical protein
MFSPIALLVRIGFEHVLGLIIEIVVCVTTGPYCRRVSEKQFFIIIYTNFLAAVSIADTESDPGVSDGLYSFNLGLHIR